MIKRLLILALTYLSIQTQAQTIRFNQLGFYSKSQKIAITLETGLSSFDIVNAATNKVEYTGTLTTPKTWSSSGESVQIIDFTDFTKSGSFYIKIGENQSSIFKIDSKDILKNLTIWTLKSFYMWRASTAIDSSYAGFGKFNFARKAGHSDNKVIVHSSAASTNRPAGTILSAPKGWYDAGDYNLYTVNASLAVFSMLHLYEDCHSFFDTLKTNIPESSNKLPDILDEVKWETDWLLKMIDTTDGSVYHKLSSLYFCGMVQPNNDGLPRYMIGKSTAAALDFAAMTAKAYRTFIKFNNLYPGYADTLLSYSKKAYQWAIKNPAVYYKNPADVSTGSYSDNDVSDEFVWARIELFLSTKDINYFNAINIGNQAFNIPEWRNIRTLGLFSLAQSFDTLTVSQEDKNTIYNRMLNLANSIELGVSTNPYKVAVDQFNWGSNGYTASQGMILLVAYKLSKDNKYLNAAVSVLDYLLGRNPTGYSYITGFGSKYPLNIHDRRCESDNNTVPIPGYLCGGPNGGKKTDCAANYYTSSYPAKSYLDMTCSYTTNEIAINWSGPLVYMVGAIQTYNENFSIKPINAETDTIGKIINIEFQDELIASNLSTDQFSVIANNKSQTIDSVKISTTHKNKILIFLKDTIKNNDTLIIASFLGKNIKTVKKFSIDSIFSINVKNYTHFARPFILSAKTTSDGLAITVKTSEKVTSNQDNIKGLKILFDGEDMLMSSKINESDSTEIIISTKKIFKQMPLVLYLTNCNLENLTGQKILDINEYSISNNSAPEPPKPISSDTFEDGYTAKIYFDRPIIKNANSIVISTEIIDNNANKKNIQLKTPPNLAPSELILNYSTQFCKGDTLIVSYKSGSLYSAEGDSVFSFSEFKIPVNITSSQDTFIISKEKTSKIEAEDYSYNNGFSKGNCTDINATLNLTNTDAGDWVEYFIDVKDSGYYVMDIRVISTSNTSTLTVRRVNSNFDLLTKVQIPQISGWQTTQAEVYLTPGIQSIRLIASTSFFNINWFAFTKGKLTNSPITNKDDDIYNIYPNPTNTGEFYIESKQKSAMGSVKIIDCSGKTILEKELANGSQKLNIPRKGIFIIQITDDNKTYNKQIIVQ